MTTTTTSGLDSSGGTSESPGASTTASTATGSGTAEGSGTSPGDTDEDHGVACPDIYAAVCGKDGETYDNACVAAAAGVEVRREGPCLGDCEGSCVVAPVGPSLLALLLVVLACIRPRRPGAGARA